MNTCIIYLVTLDLSRSLHNQDDYRSHLNPKLGISQHIQVSLYAKNKLDY